MISLHFSVSDECLCKTTRCVSDAISGGVFTLLSRSQRGVYSGHDVKDLYFQWL